MAIKKCRVCGNKFFKKPLLRYKNMPKVVQFLPDAKSVKKDKGVDLKVYQCSGCGLVQLSNDPVPYYRQVIRAVGVSEEMKNFRLKQFKNLVKNYSLKGKKIIEIGCGCGEYLSIMQKSGVKAYGLEQSAESAAKCLKNKLKVSKGFIQGSSYKLKNSPFDAFFILCFLEHLPDPNSILRGIHNNLTEDGVGLVEVPNFDMILRKNLFSEFIGDHLFYFTKETLSLALQKNGFEIQSCNEVWHDYIISAVVRKRKKLEMSHFYKHQAKLKNEIEKYIACFKNKKVAVWGAGHQALALISLADIGSKIRYVVDSAYFKQGKYTPATHVPIVSPDKLNSDPVDAVIVMAAGYSDEVAGIIKKNYDKKIKVSILRDFGLEKVKQ